MTDILKTDPNAKVVVKIVSRKICRALASKDIPRMSLITFQNNEEISDRYVIKIQAQIINHLCEKVDKIKAMYSHEEKMGKIYKNRIGQLQRQTGEKGNGNGTPNHQNGSGGEKGKETVVFSGYMQHGGNIQGVSDNGMGVQGWS